MVPIGINRGDQLCQGHATLAGDFLEALPESSRLTLVLWPEMSIERLKTEDFMPFPRQ
jgi:hypothetical protein